jgi:signal transduction histidine kinase
MTPTAGRLSSLRFKLFLLLAGPLLVALATALGGRAPATIDDRSASERAAQRITAAFGTLLEDVADVAATALASSPSRAWAEYRLRPGSYPRRLEGVGLMGPDLEFLSWAGMPPDPPEWFADSGHPDFALRPDGVRTRLLARAGPDARGRTVLVSFLVDSTLDDVSFRDLVPHDRQGALRIETRNPDVTADDALPLRSPAGELLAVVHVSRASPEQRARRVRQVGWAWTVLLFLVLLAFLFEWRSICERWPGFLLATALLVAGRGLLVWQNVTGRLLPRELGSPSVYGSSKILGMLESPADLLLTGGMLYLFCLAARSLCRKHSGLAARLCSGVVAAAMSVAVMNMALSLARNSRVPLLERPAPFEWDARLTLWLALTLTILGAAELWAVSLRPARGTRAMAGASAVHVALGLVLLSTLASLLLLRQSEHLAIEQLRSEYAPQVLDQAARRRLTLTTSMQEIIDELVEEEDVLGSRNPAYEEWVRSALFHGRYRSSLDFYAADGTPVDHFGFGLPPLEEEIRLLQDPAPGIEIKEEWIQVAAAEPRLLHAEAPLFKDGEPVGIVVGHVLDEPENLPFLPWSLTYLAALGPGVPRPGAGAPDVGLQYVLYDPFGGVSLTTLLQPPADTEQLRAAAAARRTIPLTAGDERYSALALEEDDGRLHLLMLPRRTTAETLGAMARLCLLGLALFACTGLFARGFAPGGLSGLLHVLRGSFYRKLLAALLLASIVPLVGLALFLRGYLERRGDAAVIASATQFVSAAQRVVEDYSADATESEQLNDSVLHWLRRIVGQEIHLYRDGALQASSTRELFDSGLLAPRLDGEVQRRLADEGLPYLVAPMFIGPSEIPVAYAPVRQFGDSAGRQIVAVPLVLEQQQIARGVSRVAEMILLATVALVGLLAVAAAILARTVARPVRDLVAATGQIAAGDYATRLVPKTQDEVAELVDGFNTMAAALARQRADIERRRDYIETLLRHATTGVVSLDTEGRVVTINPAANALLPTTLGVGANLEQALSDETTAPLARSLIAARSGEPVDVDLSGDRPRRLRGVRVELLNADGQRFGTLILLEDVTELMRSNQLAAWAEMARAIAHEIKNPLTPIQLSTEHLGRLLDDRREGATDDERDCLETIIKQVRALYDIAGEFSAYAKLPVLAPEPTEPAAFMREVVSPYRVSNPRGITVAERYDESPPMAADAKVLSRAVINLIENALQAMPGGGTLTVGVRHGNPDGPVELSVTDTGPGLSGEVRRRLFEPYFSTKSSGTGLGLAIARRAVEAHGGTIEVQSVPQQGTTFRILIPVHPA